MNKKVLAAILLILFTVILGIVWYFFSSKGVQSPFSKTKESSLEMAVYNKGGRMLVGINSPYFQQVQVEAEDLLVSADSGLFLLVTPETIKRIKEQESCLELIYSQPKTFTSSFNELEVKPDRLLIPLSGEFVGTKNNVVIFIGDRKAYSSGPYVNSRGVSKLKSLLNAAGVKEF
ncbi:MAG: hypothetical protein A2126_00690 [Candidatus Woykebacteria bacterium GWB1_45_5]|uniref:Uncharacterized protein n=2 Tax=Candidatus Woykeibacteriota TaxID=1817899 RepID=A0A1G1W2J5_9BACT|nr:MAG: hypothetical protein A2113_00970 [Candidatus Woykebacteria bacterium GWA1_44_8]OGY24236.1 MAG: hypothetical protein A2126_00690 [Candidatus Woykebacteria bacterium GWB1_45_5]